VSARVASPLPPRASPTRNTTSSMRERTAPRPWQDPSRLPALPRRELWGVPRRGTRRR
jgi:hypothetical protein